MFISNPSRSLAADSFARLLAPALSAFSTQQGANPVARRLRAAGCFR